MASSSQLASLDDMLDVLDRLDVNKFKWDLTKLKAIRAWALDRAGVDYDVGDKVRIKDTYRMNPTHSDGQANGWWHYRECLVPGATATVMKIDFNPYHGGYWTATIKLDREWSVGENPDTCKYDVRRWHGSAADTPDGMEPPSGYDQENYPEGRKHTFAFDAEMLSRVPADSEEANSE